MITLKKGNIFMIFNDFGEIDANSEKYAGIYYLDNRLIKKFQVDFKGYKKRLVELRNDYECIEIRSILEKDEKNEAFLKEKLKLTNNDKFEYEISVKSWRKVKIFPKFVIDYMLDDLMDIRFSKNKLNTVIPDSKNRNMIVYDTDNLQVIVKNDLTDFEEIILNPNEEYNKKITWEIQFKVKKTDLKELIENKYSDYKDFSFEIYDSEIEELMNNSLNDIRALMLESSFGSVPAAGLPLYSTVFGRDSLIFALQVMDFMPEMARNILFFLSKLQAKKLNSKNEAEPGKIPHEIRYGKDCLKGIYPFAIYYGSVDSTPLFIMVIGEYLKKTQDLKSIKKIFDSFERALEWIQNYGDKNKDLFVEHDVDGALRNQGWKDSDEAVIFENGEYPEGPISLVEVQGYVYKAYECASEIYKSIGDFEKAVIYKEKAERLKEKFDKLFWLEDYAPIALDKGKRKVDSITSNPAHAIFTGIFSKEKVKKIVERIMKDDMLTPFGVRTMSSKMKGYNPLSYHNGSIWPHDNSLIIMGLKKYGYEYEAKELAKRLLKASKSFDYKLPELYLFDESFGLMKYPEACYPQLWAAGSSFIIYKTLKEGGWVL